MTLREAYIKTASGYVQRKGELFSLVQPIDGSMAIVQGPGRMPKVTEWDQPGWHPAPAPCTQGELGL